MCICVVQYPLEDVKRSLLAKYGALPGGWRPPRSAAEAKVQYYSYVIRVTKAKVGQW